MGKKEITKNTLVFSLSTMLSRILGFIRDILIARYFGATPITDAFFVAFRIPNLFRRILGEGALSSAFIPIFAEEEKRYGKIEHVINSAFSSLLIVLALLLILGELFTPQLVALIAPGYLKNPQQLELTVELTKITFPYIFFMGLAILVGAALNYKKDFFYTSFSPCLLNISMITAIILAKNHFQRPVFALAWGVFWGGILQILFHFLGAKKLKVLPNPFYRPFTEPVIKALKLMTPATIGLAIHQINTLVDTVLASFLPKGSISYLYYANRLFQLPLALFGIAIGTVLLPYAAQAVAQGKEQEVIENTKFSIDFVLYITVPAAMGLIIFSFPIIDVLFRRGIFVLEDSYKTALALAMYAIGLPFISTIKIVVSLFHSHMDMKTPVKAAGIGLVINIILNLILMNPLKHAGLALATSLASIAQLLYLTAKLSKFYSVVEIMPKSVFKTLLVCLATTSIMIALFLLFPYNTKYTLHIRALQIWTYIVITVSAHLMLGKILRLEPSTYFIKTLLRKKA
ncbi:virulence factor [Thermosulfidibacter takaii ABI70S6]|uniref:Probable lipid II flippase MurJ n=1 Tax=Thermosulfidibacter takaii (strain DSM 17441 / JCM 13301 / NBRC 103674 / ABI70S6) TaxID=1298851 RepID=A0A0S3QSY0_THET7|nr:murein biosynthesis integral membrane protein MurJ [Thermosulfidibacter takaii]BAT71429.1 virulence factor [Thermosulfidibacter takaii ABI70S6]